MNTQRKEVRRWRLHEVFTYGDRDRGLCFSFSFPSVFHAHVVCTGGGATFRRRGVVEVAALCRKLNFFRDDHNTRLCFENSLELTSSTVENVGLLSKANAR